MKTYLVGGAVRDELLGITPGDRDWVVVGATPEQMHAQGFRAVGRDFPVFLHPHTGEEYALARTERKSGRGYRGFVVQSDPAITLEEDLLRRDFTINAIARDPLSQQFIDPYGGIRDIEQRVLRHVSAAFVEDPLRVLRAGRFLARLTPYGFTLAEETAQLMQQMVASGELDALVPERVWQELRRALALPKPSAFLRCLRSCGALAVILPEVDALYGVPQRADFHPEIDTGNHVERVCDMAAQLAPGDDVIGFAALTHDLGKALTPQSELPRHIEHEKRGLQPLAVVCQRLKVSSEHQQVAHIVCREHLHVHRIDELRPGSVLALISRCDGFRRPQRINQLALACECDARGRLGFEQCAYRQRQTLQRLHLAACVVKASELNTSGLNGPALGQALKQARIQAIAEAMRKN